MLPLPSQTDTERIGSDVFVYRQNRRHIRGSFHIHGPFLEYFWIGIYLQFPIGNIGRKTTRASTLIGLKLLYCECQSPTQNSSTNGRREKVMSEGGTVGRSTLEGYIKAEFGWCPVTLKNDGRPAQLHLHWFARLTLSFSLSTSARNVWFSASIRR